MYAMVLDVRPTNLLVRDLSTRQRVVVHTSNPRRFSPGSLVTIYYSGAMTMSIPPQISADFILPLTPGGCPCNNRW